MNCVIFPNYELWLQYICISTLMRCMQCFCPKLLSGSKPNSREIWPHQKSSINQSNVGKSFFSKTKINYLYKNIKKRKKYPREGIGLPYLSYSSVNSVKFVRNCAWYISIISILESTIINSVLVCRVFLFIFIPSMLLLCRVFLYDRKTKLYIKYIYALLLKEWTNL